MRWGAIGQLDDEIVARCVHALRAAGPTAPAASVSTRTAGTAELLAEVRRGQLQLAVVQHPVLVDGLVAGPVITVDRYIVLPAEHRAATAAAPRASMLADLALATAPRADNPPGHDVLLDALRRRGLDPATEPATTHREVSAAVAAGRCFGLATPTAPVHTGTVHRRMLGDDVTLRVRIVTAGGGDLDELVYAVDRELLRANK